MAGSGETLCVCEKCRRFVAKRWNIHDDRDDDAPFRCPYCKREIRAVFDVPEAPSCPKCETPITVEACGVWD